MFSLQKQAVIFTVRNETEKNSSSIGVWATLTSKTIYWL